MSRLIAILMLLVACDEARVVSRVQQSSCICASDAGADAAADARPDAMAVDWGHPWTRHVIYPGAATGPYRGADGIDLGTIGGHLAIAVPWEQGGAVTVSFVAPTGAWQTITAATGMFSAEDAKFGDFDGDGLLDVAIARDGDARINIAFQPTVITDPWPTVTLTASQTPYRGRWMQLAIADVDGDGLLDIVGGSRVGTASNPAVIAWFKNPGTRAGAWTYNPIGLAGWAMSVLARDVDGDGDVDVVVSDRSYYLDTASVRHYELMGSRWLEHAGSTWVNHTIAQPSAGTSQAAYGMLAITDWDGDGVDDIVEGQGTTGSPNRIAIHRNEGRWLGTWGTIAVPDVANVGSYQAIASGDIDGDGRPDLVVSTTENGGVGPNYPASGVYWLRNGVAGWERRELAGPDGTKFDNVVLRDMDGDGDLDVLETEQVDQIGLYWYEDPR